MVLYPKFTYESQFSEEKNGLEIRLLVLEILNKYKRSIFLGRPVTTLDSLLFDLIYINNQKRMPLFIKITKIGL